MILLYTIFSSLLQEIKVIMKEVKMWKRRHFHYSLPRQCYLDDPLEFKKNNNNNKLKIKFRVQCDMLYFSVLRTQIVVHILFRITFQTHINE